MPARAVVARGPVSRARAGPPPRVPRVAVSVAVAAAAALVPPRGRAVRVILVPPRRVPAPLALRLPLVAVSLSATVTVVAVVSAVAPAVRPPVSASVTRRALVSGRPVVVSAPLGRRDWRWRASHREPASGRMWGQRERRGCRTSSGPDCFTSEFSTAFLAPLTGVARATMSGHSERSAEFQSRLSTRLPSDSTMNSSRTTARASPAAVSSSPPARSALRQG